MRDRIQRALDGELSEAKLTPEEARELRRYDESISAGLAGLGDDAAPDVSRAVMERIEELELEPLPSWVPAAAARTWLALVRAARWVWAPRPLSMRIRPASGFAAAAVIAAFAWVGAQRLVANRVSTAATPVMVQFRIGAADARQVALVGDFTGWKPQRAMRQLAPGMWSVVVSLTPGVYDYAFVIDGHSWRLDPLAPRVDDGFGGENSRITVFAPEPPPRLL